MVDSLSRPRSATAAWTISNALALLFIADFLFYDHDIGWTAGVYALFLMLSYLTHNAKRLTRASFIPLALCFGLISALVNSPDLLVITLFWVSFISVVTTNRLSDLQGLKAWIFPALKFAFFPIVRLVHSVKALTRAHKMSTHKSQKQSIIQKWMVPTLSSAVFITLFAA